LDNTENLCMNCMTQGLDEDGVCENCGKNSNTHLAEPHQLPPRTVLHGKYLVGRVIGEGGFGITYVGWDTSLSVKVAVKEYYPNSFVMRNSTVSATVHSFGGDKGEFYERGRRQFIEEAQRLAKLYGLPGIVTVKDFFTENDTAYIVMEFVEGATMKTVLENMGGRMPEAHVLEMMRPLIHSLAQMHKTGVIHRDIAPDNIMLLPDGSIKLLDFGAAREAATDGKSTAAIMKHGYAPEEQYDPNRTRQGPWTDVYAVCATIYRAIEGTTPPDAITRLRGDSFAGFTIPVGKNTRRVIMKGLALQPKNRWKDIEELARELYGEFKQPSPRPSLSTPHTPAARKAQSEQAVSSHPAVNPFVAFVTKNKALTAVFGAVFIAAVLFFAVRALSPAPMSMSSSSSTPIPFDTGRAFEPRSDEPRSEEDDLGDDSSEYDDSDSGSEDSSENDSDRVPGGISPSLDSSRDSMANTVGNTSGNIVNQGLAAIQGTLIYYTEMGDGGKLYVMSSNGRVKQKLNDDSADNINVVGSHIYYTTWGDERLYVVNTDGSDRQKLNDDISNYVNVAGDKIYYANGSDKGKIYVINTDGSGKRKLNDDDSLYINVVDNKIYYANKSDKGKLYVINTDGSGKQKLNDDESLYINTADNKIYYVNKSDKGKLYVINTDGSGKQKLNDDNSLYINVSGNKIYYMNVDDDGKMYVIKTDGSGRKKENDEPFFYINKVGSWTFYMTPEELELYIKNS